MKLRLTLPQQMLIGMFVGLLLSLTTARSLQAWEFLNLNSSNPDGASAPTNASNLRPFETLSSAWLVRVKFHQSSAPEIVKVTKLLEGRIAEHAGEASSITILDDQGNPLYAQAFDVMFVFGDPPRAVDSVQMQFVLPSVQGEKTIIVTTPQGDTQYELPELP